MKKKRMLSPRKAVLGRQLASIVQFKDAGTLRLTVTLNNRLTIRCGVKDGNGDQLITFIDASRKDFETLIAWYQKEQSCE